MTKRLFSSSSIGGALLVVIALILGGCEKPAEKLQPAATAGNSTGATGGGWIDGIVQLDAPDPTTGHAGTLIYLAGTSLQARTDRTGHYQVGFIPDGTYELIAEKKGFETTSIQTMVVNAEKNTYERPLRTEAIVMESESQRAEEKLAAAAATLLGQAKGKAYLQGQENHEGVRVELDGSQFVTVTDASGDWRLPNVPVGMYSLTFTKTNFRPFTLTNVQIAGGKQTPVEEVALEMLAVTRSASTTAQSAPPVPQNPQTGSRTITGVVEAEDSQGTPITDFSRVVIALNDTEIVVQPDDQGRFRIGELVPAFYTVLATLDKGDPVKAAADLTNQESVTLTIKLSEKAATSARGTVTGKVVLPGADDQPLQDASGVRISLAGTQFSATSADNGTFRIEGIPAGTLSLVAAKDGYEDLKESAIEVTGDQTLDLGELRLELKRDYPRVVSSNPPNGASNVTVNLEVYVQIKFSKKMDPDSVIKALSIQPASNARYFIGKGTHPLADDDAVVIAMSASDPSKPILFGTQYRIVVSKSASDVDGLSMKGDYALSFRTGPAGVVATRPADGEENMFLDQGEYPVIVHFNTRLDPDTVIPRNFKIKPDPRTSINISHSHDSRNGWTSVRLSTMWRQNTQYTITVDKDVRTLSKQRLGNTPYTFSFRSGDYVILSPELQTLR